jgi:20S proteasome alpha/beta subunit
MTICISLKVNDGIVLAADSAATLFGNNQGMVSVINVYENADKVFNLCKGYPIGAITWGSGSIGDSSIATLIKDFRKKITDEKVCKKSYDIEKIANLLSDFIFNQYNLAFSAWPEKPELGFVIAGYGSNKDYSEEWSIRIIKGKLIPPAIIRGKSQSGMSWYGEPEAITRLYFGHSNGLPNVLHKSGLSDEKINEIMQRSREELGIPFVIPAIPIKDAIDLAEYFVDTTIKFSKFSPGAPTVGGPIDIAVITKHEGFKWVKRKHYYNADLNPNDDQPNSI